MTKDIKILQCLASISGKQDIARREYSKMAVNELGQATNSVSKKEFFNHLCSLLDQTLMQPANKSNIKYIA